jgi:hypothetical protein
MPELNEDQHWSDMDVADLKNGLEHGDTIPEVSAFLMRSEEEVRGKMAELGLREQAKPQTP